MSQTIPPKPGNVKQTLPPKPDSAKGFNKPVSWLVGRDLIAGLKWFALFAAFKGKLDPRDWMTGNTYPEAEEKASPECILELWRDHGNWKWKVNNDKYWFEVNKREPEFWKSRDAEEFWFDYIADSGDGQMGTYGVAYLCLSDMWAKDAAPVGSEVSFEETADQTKLLPRGRFLFVGGDTAYHIADYGSLHLRFQQPFRWAFTSIRNWLKEKGRLIFPLADAEGHIPRRGSPSRPGLLGNILESDSEPARPIFGVPGNHDYYDVIDGFNRQFRQPAVKAHSRERTRPQLSLLGFERQQNASYVALRLPFGWWFWGLDTEVSKLDVRQEAFFHDLNLGQTPDKLILATPEPTTVFRERKDDQDKTLQAYAQLGLKQPFEASDDEPPGRCRLDLSGDVHHYARYYGPNTRNLPPQPNRSSEHYASVVSGGGGAFMHPSQTHVSGADAVEEQVLYPPADVSRRVFAKPLFDLRNIFDGGYVWLFGMILTGIFYFALTVPQTSKNFLEWLLLGCDSKGNCVGRTFFGYQIPFAKDSDFPGLPAVNFSRGIDLEGFVLSTILLILAMGVLGLAIYLCSRYIKQLANAPLIFDEDITDQGYKNTGYDLAINPEEANAAKQADGTADQQKPPTTYGDLWPVWLCVGAALLLYVGGIWTCVKLADRLHPFGASLLVLVHIIIAAELIILSVQTSAWLANRTKFEAGNEHSYLPVWFLTVLPCCFAFFGVWIFGSYPGAYLLSDTIFALVFVGVFVALTVLGWTKGGELQRLPGKAFMLIVGFWHAILQLTIPLLLIRIGDWRAVLGVLILLIFFSGPSIPKTRFSVRGLGARLMALPEAWSAATLTVMWFVYGAGLLVLPFLFHDRRAILIVPNGHYSSFLPQSLVDWLYQWGLLHDHMALVLTILSIAAAVFMGFLLSMSLLSWYFAVALAFHGHNNEVGGAGRIEKFRHILRVRLTKDDVTVYALAFDDPAVDGYNLKPKLVDVFRLHVT